MKILNSVFNISGNIKINIKNTVENKHSIIFKSFRFYFILENQIDSKSK